MRASIRGCRSSIPRRWYCSNTEADTADTAAAMKRYARMTSKQKMDDQRKEINMKFGETVNYQDVVDYEKAKGTVLHQIIQEGKMGILPDDEHVAVASGTHPAMPKRMPKAEGKFITEMAAELGAELEPDAQLMFNGVKSLSQIQNEAKAEKRKEFVKTRDTAIGKAQDAVQSGSMSKTEAAKTFIKPMSGMMLDESAFPPLPTNPPPHRTLSMDQKDQILESSEKQDKAMEKIYDAAFEKWKLQKEKSNQMRDDGTMELQISDEERAENIKQRQEAINVMQEKEANEPDLLEELEKKYFPEKNIEQEKEDRERFEEKKKEAQVNLKPLKNALTNMLQKQIVMTGPKPLGDFMKELMINPEYGYYTTKKKVFGREGDFITSPEISCMFAECLAAWGYDTWEKMGCPPRFYFIEIGGGRGTLMANMLKIIADSFPAFFDAMIPCLVEVSETLQVAQREKILEVCGKEIRDRVIHSDDFEGLPLRTSPLPVISLCNELFDVFAVSKFQYTERGWCEWMVEFDEDPHVPEHFKFVLSPGETANSLLSIPHDMRQKCREQRLLGKTIELQMQGYQFLERVLNQLHKLGGAFLVIDYGKDDFIEDSLRGIRDHKFVHPLSSPGEVDLSGFVSFMMLRRTVTRNQQLEDRIHVSSVMNQGEFLKRTGIEARATSHLLSANNPRDAGKITREFTKLTDEEEVNGMGKKFKFMCFTSKSKSAMIPPCPWYKDDMEQGKLNS